MMVAPEKQRWYRNTGDTKQAFIQGIWLLSDPTCFINILLRRSAQRETDYVSSNSNSSSYLTIDHAWCLVKLSSPDQYLIPQDRLCADQSIFRLYVQCSCSEVFCIFPNCSLTEPCFPPSVTEPAARWPPLSAAYFFRITRFPITSSNASRKIAIPPLIHCPVKPSLKRSNLRALTRPTWLMTVPRTWSWCLAFRAIVVRFTSTFLKISRRIQPQPCPRMMIEFQTVGGRSSAFPPIFSLGNFDVLVRNRSSFKDHRCGKNVTVRCPCTR